VCNTADFSKKEKNRQIKKEKKEEKESNSHVRIDGGGPFTAQPMKVHRTASFFMFIQVDRIARRSVLIVYLSNCAILSCLID